MNEKRLRAIAIPVLIALGLLVMLIPETSAAVVFADDFDDGNYDGWTVEAGSWEVVDGSLDADTGYGMSVPCKIWHNSSTAVGTWSFSIFHDAFTYGETFHYLYMNFMMNGTSGYGIRITHSGSIYLVRMDDDTPYPLTFIINEDIIYTWTHFTITRSGNIVSGYKNGVFVDDDELYVGGENNITMIGHGYDASIFNTYWGSMDDVRIYEKVLSDEEIWQLYQGELE